VAGKLLEKKCEEFGTRCIPVDSEHNALFQLLLDRPRSQIQSLVLTASGGPLLSMPDLPLEDVTPAVAIKHPNWKMGPKISVDSATLMNKGLELVEAHFLFGFAANQIEIWVHPQSVIHGAVWLTDNTCLAQLSQPNMKSSIGYALEFPNRLPEVIPKLSLKDFARLDFYEPDHQRFPAIKIAREALESGASHLIALNAGNEVAVEAFLAGKILFPQMATTLLELLARHASRAVNCVEDIFEIDRQSRETAAHVLKTVKK
jgi:1-deoxy-D-xylulose-5-phosphate reductoisomerase